jgi:hypothetical protein
MSRFYPKILGFSLCDRPTLVVAAQLVAVIEGRRAASPPRSARSHVATYAPRRLKRATQATCGTAPLRFVTRHSRGFRVCQDLEGS